MVYFTQHAELLCIKDIFHPNTKCEKVLLFDVSSIINYYCRNIEINITENSHFTLAYLLGKLG